MLEVAQRSMDAGLISAFDGAGLVGPRLREDLLHELKSKVILRAGRDPIEIIGGTGSGKHMVAQAAHAASQSLLDRSGPYVTHVCDSPGAMTATAIESALREAADGTLVLEQFESLRDHQQRSILRQADAIEEAPLIISLRDGDDSPDTVRSPDLPSPIRLKPLHEREDDIWPLIDHFFDSCVADTAQPAFQASCKGFSRQAKADIGMAVESVGLSSVRQLRVIIRDIVFETLALDAVPRKIKSDQVRPYLEERFGQTQAMREARDAESIGSRFDALIDRSLLEQLAEVHNVPANLMARQAELVAEITSYIDDMPRSYRNILDRAEDVQRAGLWLMTGARTQAEFRRYFGEERYMRPTKSVAWAFYNRVFKRDM